MYPLLEKSVLITGATGYIGSRVAQRLLSQGVKVRALARSRNKSAQLDSLGADVIPGDITDPAAVHSAAAGCQVVIHLAGIVAAPLPLSEFKRVNVGGTRLAAEAACDAGVERFVHASSIVVYGLSGRAINEGWPYRKSDEAYCDTKLEAELEVRRFFSEHGLPAVIVQPAPVYGPGDEAWTAGPIRRILQGSMVYINGGQGYQHPIYVDDVVEGILAAAKLGIPGQAYILCGPRVLRMKDFFGYYARMTGRTRPIPSIPKWLGLAVAAASEGFAKASNGSPFIRRQEVLFSALDVSYDGAKAQRELGFTPTIDLDEGMQRVEAWTRSQGILAPVSG